jgi:sec-independent protein translocase protein TatC
MDAMMILIKILANQSIGYLHSVYPQVEDKSNIIHNQFTIEPGWSKNESIFSFTNILGAKHLETQEQFDQQTLTEHLAELRSCLLISLGAVVVGFVIVNSFIQSLAEWFLMPLVKVLPAGKPLIFTSYQDGFFFTLN